MTGRTRPIWRYFLLTFALTWGLQLPGVVAGWLAPASRDAYLPLAGLGIFGPLVAATWFCYADGGRAQVAALYGGLLRWRVHVGWYVVALAVPAALLTLMLWLLNQAGRQGPLGYFPALGALVFGVVISVAEEVGWRGYALPRLQERYGAFGASGILGVAWYLWHIPMFLGQGVPLDLAPVMLLHFTGASLLMTWIYNGTGRSVLLVALAHLGAHLNNSHRALPDDVAPLIAHAVIYAALGLIVMRRSDNPRSGNPGNGGRRQPNSPDTLPPRRIPTKARTLFGWAPARGHSPAEC